MHSIMSNLFICLLFYLMSNPIYSEGFSNTDKKRTRDGNVHYIF